MGSAVEMSGSWTLLSDVIKGIRNRWRLRTALHGLTIVLGTTLATLLVSAWFIWLFHFNPTAVVTLRILSYALIAGVIVRYLVLPLQRRTTDAQVALYLEEHEPSLDAVMLSAVEAGTSDLPVFVRSPGFVRHLVDMAATRAAAIGNGARIETRSITMSLLEIAGILAATVLILAFGPEYLRTSAHLLAAPRLSAAQQMFISVHPGDAKVSMSGDEAISAHLHGFDADQAVLVTQRGSGQWERIPMTLARDSGAFVIRLFDLKERTSYYIESNGVRSPTYHLDIVSLPYVKHLTLEYHYPSYTGLAPTVVDNSGDIAALEGTAVIVHAKTTMPVQGGQIVIAGHAPIPMKLGADGSLIGTIPVTAPGFYKIELQAGSGNLVPGSLDYTIDVLKDNDPTITFIKPGRDVNAAPTDTVFTQVQATDDYGLASVQLHYSVNGGPEEVISLHDGAAKKEVIAGYSFLLNTLKVTPSDVVSYYAQATDNDALHGGKTVKTDLYFLKVRIRRHKGGDDDDQQQQQNGQGKKGEGMKDPSVLVRKQREIIVGTFKVDRDKSHTSTDVQRESQTTLGLGQAQLHKQVEDLARKIVERGLPQQNPGFQTVADELMASTKEMQTAEGSLAGQDTHSAMAPEQRSLQHLQKAEAAYRSLVKQQKQQQQQQQDQDQDQDQDQPDDNEDMANMFQPKKDQMNQQYEADKKAQQQHDSSEIQKLEQKLKQLAERQMRADEQQQQQQQQQANQQQSGQQQQNGQQQQTGQQQSGQQQSGQNDQQQNNQQQQNSQQQGSQQRANDGGASQRQLAADVERVARQLEQVAHQQPDDRKLSQSAQQLKDAANAMRQAASGNLDRSASALAKLREAQRLLAQSKSAGANADPKQQLLDRAHDLVGNAESLNDRVQQMQQQSQDQQHNGQQQASQGQQTAQQLGQQQGAQQSKRQQAMQQGGQQPGQQQPGQQSEQQNQQGQPSQQQGGQQPSVGFSKDGLDPGNIYVPGSSGDQLAREYQQERQSTEDLAQQLRRQGYNTERLQQAIERMRALETPGAYRGASAVPTASLVADELKQWEFELRQQLELNKNSRPVLGGNSDVPADYQALVADYYRSLGKRP